MISKMFLQAVKLCLSASIVTGLVLLLRLAFKKAPKSLVCALWILVGLRLVIPTMPSSSVSVIPEAVSGGTAVEALEKQYVEETTVIREDQNEELYKQITSLYRELPVYREAGTSYVVVAAPTAQPVNPTVSQSAASSAAQSATPAPAATQPAASTAAAYTPPKTFGDSVVPTLSVVWIVGIGIMLLYMAGSYLTLHRRLRTAVIREKGVWESDQIGSPFILGIIRPRIYLPMSLSGEEREFVLAHERTHLKRGDQFWKPLGYLLLAVYWFNPLFWLAYFLLCRDIESACDERVIRSEGTAYRKAYSETLLKLNVRQKAVTACPLAFAENGVGGRIRRVLNYKKPAFWVIAAALVIGVVAAGCALTDPTKKESSAAESTEQTESEASTEESTEAESTAQESTAAETEPVESTVPETEPAPAEREQCTARILVGSVYDEKTGVMINMTPGVEAGPSDFAVISDGDILILDVLVHRLQHYKDGTYYETIRLPEDQDCLKLCVIGENAYVLTLDSLLKVDLNTKKQSSIPLPDMTHSGDSKPGQCVIDMLGEDGKLYLVTGGYGNYSLNEETQALEKAGANAVYSISRIGGSSGDNVRVTKGNRSWTVHLPGYFYGDVLGFDQEGNLYYQLTDWNKMPKDEGWRRILKCDADEGIKAESIVDTAKWIYHPQGSAKMGSDGNVYILGLYEEKFIVYRLKVGAEDIREPEMVRPSDYNREFMLPPEVLNYTASYSADGKEYTCRFSVSWPYDHIYSGDSYSGLVWRGASYTLEGSGPVFEKLRESIPKEAYLWHKPGDESGKCYVETYAGGIETFPYIQLEPPEYDPWKPIYSQWADLGFVLRSPAAEGVSLVFKPSEPEGRKMCRTSVLQGILNDENAGIICYWKSDFYGPKDFTVISDDDILILDVDEMHRIQRFKNGEFFETISLPEGQEYFRICAIGENVYVLTLDDLLKIDLNTKEQTAISLPKNRSLAHPGYGVADMLERDGKLYLYGGEYYANYCLNEETQKLEKVGKNEPYSIDEDQNRVLTEDRTWDNIDSLNSFSFLIGFDQEENLYLSHFDELTNPEPEGCCRIVKRAAGGEIEAESFVDTSIMVFIPKNFAKVGADGSVYVLGIYKWIFVIYKLNVGVEDIGEPQGLGLS